MKRIGFIIALSLFVAFIASSCDDTPTLKIHDKIVCGSNADCQSDEICLDGLCVVRSPFCPPIENCYDWQVCDESIGRCVDKTQSDADFDSFDIDTDSTADKDFGSDKDSDSADEQSDSIDADGLDGVDTIDSADVDPDADAEDSVDADDVDLDVGSCVRDEDCPADSICQCTDSECLCVADCTISGCGPDEGRCNPQTGHCEWCNPPCQEGESCNYSAAGWYCGKACEPPCPDGYACFEDSCIELVCPTCPPCYVCSASTGYVCQYDASSCTDGDVDVDEPVVPNIQNHPQPPAPMYFMQCLPATSPCTEGVSNCCSGACVMGFCL